MSVDSPAALTIDDRSIVLPGDLEPEGTYDVLLNGLHVWSLQPSRDTTAKGGGLKADWPKALRRYLVGRCDVVVRQHLSEEPLATGHHVFEGRDDVAVEVTDKLGNPLVLDKYMRLTRPLSAEGDATLEEFLEQVATLCDDLRDKAGVPAFISYGTLLGAVRNGRLIGHDNDVDIAYISEQPTPVDVVREGFHVERVLAEAGWVVRRGSGSRVNVRIRQPDGTLRYVDVFTAHWVEGILYMPSDTGFELPRETILPLTTVELHGRPMPAPADSDRLLAATYGPGYLVPDPAFKYETPVWLSRRLGGWFGGLRTDRKAWDAFYAGPSKQIPNAPSSFATWVHETYPSTRPIVDLGAGTGRDSRFFARQGRAVTAIDYVFGVLKRWADRKPEPPVLREVLNLNDYRHVASLGHRLSRTDEPADLYGRFLLHALDDTGRENLVRLASMSLRRGGLLFLEFRTGQDRRRPHHFDNPRRRFLDVDQVVAELEGAGGRILHREAGTGLATMKTEDPHVCRLVVSFER